MKKLICTLIILLAGTAGLQASSPDSLFRQGNAFFNQGLYNDAIAAYQRILNQGDVSWQIYYNLGNAHFKIDELADAIYFYEKALKLDPDNEDIQYNLKIANSKIVDKIEPLPEFFLKKWWKAIYLYFSLTTWSILVIAGFILFILLMVTFLISHNPAYKRFTFWTGILVILFTAISFCAAFKKYHENIKQD
ncbi:MAG: tetratricopeptide repeat protein, partial [Bacteroidales bacterium]|nr:tetratricopeptide repeat protein [Bacteroidales bacterium]